MAGYKCVNFGDLCRLCASSNGGRIGIFSDEGKRKNIHVKITDCLKIKVYEKDRLPKSVCAKCLKQLEAHVEFRESVVKAQGMLESCLNSTKLRNGGMVYIKDDSIKDDPPATASPSTSISSPSSATITLPTIQTHPPTQSTPQVKLLPTIPASSSTLQQQQQTATITTAPTMTPIIINSLPKGFAQAATSGTTTPLQTATIMAPNADFLNSIMQAVGIQTGETSVAAAAVAAAASTQETIQHQGQNQQQQQQQPLAQYTITVDGQTIKANQIHYKIQEGTGQAVLTAAGGDGEQQQQQGTSYQQMDEFLKLKTPVKINRRELEKTPESISAKKPKISVLIKSPQTPQATLVTSTPPKQTILATATPMATVSSSPITLTPVSSNASIATFSSAPTGTIFTSSPISVSSVGSTPVKSTAAIPVLDAKMMQGNKCIVPIMLKSEGGGEQIALAPIANVGDMNKTMVPNVQYVQMKLQPGPDGMFRLAPAQMPPALTLTPQGLQQFGISPMQTIQTQPAQQHQQIQIQPQQIQAQLSMPSVQVPLSNYLSLVEKSSQLQSQSTAEVQPQQANIVITTQPVQQQPQQQQQQTPVQQTQHLQVVQRPTIQVQQPVQQPPPKPLKSNPPQPPPQPPPPPTATRRQSSSQDQSQHNSSSESMSNVTNASLAATQQMKAISALSLLKQDTHDSVSGTTSQGNNQASVSSTVSFTSCDVCSKSFKRKEHLMQHLKSHVGLRPFKCDEAGCSKSFSRKEHLMRHIVSHTGKKLFACPVCRKYFSRKDNLKKHKKTHQDNSSSAPYHCTICSKHFYIKGHFLKHKQMHDMASEAQKSEKRSPVKVKTGSSEQTQQLPTVQQSQQQQQQQLQQQQQQQLQQQQQQQPQHQIQQVQLPTQQQQRQAQPQPQMPPVSLQSQQIFTIPAAQLQSALSGKGSIIQQLQIAMPTSMAAATSHSTLQTVSASTLAGLGVGGATGGGTKTAIIKSADGSSATVYTLPSNFIIDGTQFLGAMQQQQQQQQSRELMGSIGNIKIEQIT